MSDWFLVRFLSNIWKKKQFRKSLVSHQQRPNRCGCSPGPKIPSQQHTSSGPELREPQFQKQEWQHLYHLATEELTNSRQGFFSMQEHPKRKMHCSGEDDKALDLRVPCFQTNPSADEVGLPFHQRFRNWWFMTKTMHVPKNPQYYMHTCHSG